MDYPCTFFAPPHLGIDQVSNLRTVLALAGPRGERMCPENMDCPCMFPAGSDPGIALRYNSCTPLGQSDRYTYLSHTPRTQWPLRYGAQRPCIGVCPEDTPCTLTDLSGRCTARSGRLCTVWAPTEQRRQIFLGGMIRPCTVVVRCCPGTCLRGNQSKSHCYSAPRAERICPWHRVYHHTESSPTR